MFTLSEPENPYKVAAEVAIERVNRQWSNWQFNIWAGLNPKTEDPNWIAVWYPFNIEGNGSISADEELQNQFYLWCWLKMHGYSHYSIVGVMASCMQESHTTGVLWENIMPPNTGTLRPYATLATFDAQYETGNKARTTWHINGSLATWTAIQRDYYADLIDPVGAPHIEYLPADPGSWDAVQQYPMKTELVNGIVHVVFPKEFDKSVNRTTSDVMGYGLVQWTNFTVLINHAARATSQAWRADRTSKGDTSGDGQYYWPANPTLQLMVLDYEESQNDVTDPDHQTSQDHYYGEWNDRLHGYMLGSRDTSAGHTRVGYDQDMKWGYFKTDAWIQRAYAKMISTEYAAEFPTEEDRQNGLYFLALSTWGRAYLHHDYGSSNATYASFTSRFNRCRDAINYWEQNGYYNPEYIPRAYDIEYCELDQYHINPMMFASLAMRRRKRKNERTLLF